MRGGRGCSTAGPASSALEHSTHPPTNFVLRGGGSRIGSGSETGPSRGTGGTLVFAHLEGAEETCPANTRPVFEDLLLLPGCTAQHGNADQEEKQNVEKELHCEGLGVDLDLWG